MIEATSCGGVVIFRGKILLLYKHVRNKYEGWVLPKGTVEEGEEFPQTALREVLEESGAKPGDIIRWITDDLGFVTKIQVAMKNDGLNSKLYTGGYQTGYYSDFRITCGSVQNLNNKYILFKYGDQYETSLRNPSARILIYDSQKEKVSAGSYDSIKTVAAFGDEASLVFTYQWYTAIQTIVIFN